MNKKSFQLLIARHEKRNDTQAFEWLKNLIKDLFIPLSAKKKILNIWMELYQNMLKFGSSGHLALFRLEISSTGLIQLISMNFSRKFHLDILEQKFLFLEKSQCLKGDFQKKLQSKIENGNQNSGDFGIDFCFRYSIYRKFKRIKQVDNEEIVYLSFSFPSYE